MKRLLPLLALVAAPLAMAHPGHAEGATFLEGFLHPLTGFDHLLAMLAVGLWSAASALSAKNSSPPPSQGREFLSLLQLPFIFVTLLLGGIVLGNTYVGLPAVEPMIAVSLLVLGAAAGFGKQISQAATLMVVGLFAVFHGYAHGAELGANVAAIAGIALATSLLHIAGIALGMNAVVRRAVAAVVAAGGVFFLLQLT